MRIIEELNIILDESKRLDIDKDAPNGLGLQFKVYENSNNPNQVVKVMKDDEEMKTRIKELFPSKKYEFKVYGSLYLNKKLKKHKKIREISMNYVRNLANKRANLDFLGNPFFFKDIIIQERVIPFKNIINDDFERAKILIEEVIKVTFESWKLGFMDKDLNIDVNYGTRKDNSVILLDFGEILLKKNLILKRIKQRKWNQTYCFDHRLSNKVKEYFDRRLTQELTEENLNKHWCQNYKYL